jgi:hypothetical protein
MTPTWTNIHDAVCCFVQISGLSVRVMSTTVELDAVSVQFVVVPWANRLEPVTATQRSIVVGGKDEPRPLRSAEQVNSTPEDSVSFDSSWMCRGRPAG